MDKEITRFEDIPQPEETEILPKEEYEEHIKSLEGLIDDAYELLKSFSHLRTSIAIRYKLKIEDDIKVFERALRGHLTDISRFYDTK